MRRLIARLRGGKGPLATIVRGAGLTFPIMAAGAGLGFLTQIVVARWLGTAEYGDYRYALAWASILAVLATLGLDSAVLRFIPEHLAKGEWSLAKGVMLRSWQATAAAGCLIALLGTSAIVLLNHRFDVPLSDVLMLGMWVIPFQATLNLQKGMGRGLGSVALAFLPNNIAKPLLLIGGLLLVRAAFGTLDALSAVAVTIAGGGLLVALQILFLWGRLSTRVREAPPTYATRRWFRISLPLLLMTAFLLLLNRTDVIMLGALVDTGEVGIYHAAAKCAELVGFILMAVNALAAPTIAEMYAHKRHTELQAAATAVAQYAFWPSLAIAAALVVTGPLILRLFGPDFVAGRGVLTVLVFAQVVNAGAGSVTYFLNMTGHQDDSTRVFGSVAVLNLVLNGMAIPLFGALGAAVATGVSMITWNLWMHSLVVRRLGIRTSVLSLLTKR